MGYKLATAALAVLCCNVLALAQIKPPSTVPPADTSGVTTLPGGGAYVAVDEDLMQRLDALDTLARQKPEEAAHQVRKILDDAVGMTPTRDDRRYINGRLALLEILPKLDPAALAQYRQISQGNAESQLKAAWADRDVARLLRIVKQYPFTPAADEAVDHLAALHYDRGEFSQAIALWYDLLPHAANKGAILGRIALAYHLDGQQEKALALIEQIKANCAAETLTIDGKAVSVAQLAQQVKDLPVVTRATTQPAADTPQNSLALAYAQVAPGVDTIAWQESPPAKSFLACSESLLHLDGEAKPSTGQLWMGSSQDPDKGKYCDSMVWPMTVGLTTLYRDDSGVTALNEGGKELWHTAVWMHRSAADIPAPADKAPDVTDAKYWPFAQWDHGQYGLAFGDGLVFAIGEFLPPTVHIAGHETSSISAISLKDGKIRWQIGKGKGSDWKQVQFISAPTFHDGKVYVVGFRGDVVLYCFAAASGSLQWSAVICPTPGGLEGVAAARQRSLVEGPGQWACPPVVSGDRVFVMTNRVIAGVDRRDGETLWLTVFNSDVEQLQPNNRFGLNALILTDDALVGLPPDYGKAIAVSPVDGRLLWQSPREGRRYLVRLDDRRVALVEPGAVIIDAAKGKTLHTIVSADLPSAGAPIVAGQELLTCGGGKLFRMNLKDYKVTSTPLPKGCQMGNMAIGGGRILFANVLGITAVK